MKKAVCLCICLQIKVSEREKENDCNSLYKDSANGSEFSLKKTLLIIKTENNFQISKHHSHIIALII